MHSSGRYLELQAARGINQIMGTVPTGLIDLVLHGGWVVLAAKFPSSPRPKPLFGDFAGGSAGTER